MQCKTSENELADCPRTFEIRLRCPTAQQPAVLAGLRRFGRNCIIDKGLVNAATVSGFGDVLYFLVTDKRGQRGDNAYRTWKNELKKVTCPDLRKLPEVATVEDVRPFTRLSQRRFGWGDAQASREDVVAAVQEENAAELLAIMPEARPLIQRDELEHLPALFDAMRSGLPAALVDCRHEFFTEHMFMAAVLGPCGACGKTQSGTYKMGFTRCSTCNEVRCKPCATTIDAEQEQQQSFMRAYHEVKNSHVWTASKEECDLCGRGPCDCGGKHCDDCRADVKTEQCVCGIVRCSKCSHVHVWCDPAVHAEVTEASPAQAEPGDRLPVVPEARASVIASTLPQLDVAAALRVEPAGCSLCGQAPRKVCGCGEARCEQCLPTGEDLVETWYSAHPLHQPATCYITDQQKTKSAEQVEWIVFELGKGADLIPFTRKYRDLFGEQAQKAKCLGLYRQYANIANRDDRGPYPTLAEARKKLYSMECQIPPGELEEFQKLWDPDAPRRCHECHNELPADARSWHRFCCAEHVEAGTKVMCSRVLERQDVNGEEVVTYCSGDVVLRSGCRVCTACGQGSDVAKIISRRQKLTGDTEANKSAKCDAESHRIWNNVFGKFAAQSDPNHVPAWTKRRRL